MDLNHYAVEMTAAQRLAELRERGARHALLATGRRARPPLSRRIGVVLIRVGHWLARSHPGSARNAGVRLAR
ncbi:MAG TPA: hypothetical protein VIG37_07845 [Methylomirabilota bacterium]|jgi:hypothetical protein